MLTWLNFTLYYRVLPRFSLTQSSSRVGTPFIASDFCLFVEECLREEAGLVLDNYRCACHSMIRAEKNEAAFSLDPNLVSLLSWRLSDGLVLNGILSLPAFETEPPL
ncbi:hypothetical protein CEXT_33531 [Caerostris extrusa]|uniref:Uncharacterized protein n=1 Tax=Caerostris extrusa TaxID=172846 RepID=A0AAV4PR36_CAEEX|nr:hypothetical protein CEXT_33531 [Caerostris extrusa]